MFRSKDVASGPGRKERRCAPDEVTNRSSECVEPQESAEGVLQRRWVQGFKVPLLNNRKIKVSRMVPRLSSFKLCPATAVVEEAPLEASVTKRPRESAQQSKPPSAARTKVVPAPKEEVTRPQRAKASALEPVALKPLKVIRRRREEAPKVFETPPKIVPKAMLEGIDIDRDTDAEN